MVALSLRTRDPVVARRLGMRLNLVCAEWSDKMGMGMGMLLPPNMDQLLRGYVEREDYLHLERFRTDMEASPPVQFGSQTALFKDRATQDRIFARLHRFAKEEGPVSTFTEAMNAELKSEGFTTFERDKICQRMENGYVGSLLKANDNGIGMPSPSCVDEVLASTATPITVDTRENVLRFVAGSQERILTKYADLYGTAATEPHLAWQAAGMASVRCGMMAASLRLLPARMRFSAVNWKTMSGCPRPRKPTSLLKLQPPSP